MAESGAIDGRDTDIAVVGRAVRFPGAPDPDRYWRNLRDGIESIRTLSDAELRSAGVDRSLLHDPSYVKRAATLDDVAGFDAGFFGFSAKDAAIMDPQHRHLLECAWAALEDAGHPPERFDGAIGVFAGCGANWYLTFNLLSNPELVDDVGLFLLRHTANDKDFLPTRISYELNLHGPSVAVQTACSTSLVAIHMAGQSLMAGECDLALAGGVTIEIPHGRGYRYEEGEILAPDGRCRAFDADAAGTVFGSGAGVVVLRRLDDALRDGDTVHAVVRASALNNDGARKVSYLAPSVDGQVDAISEAIAFAEIDPATVTYLEAHGTGTPVGDPIEVQALATAYGPGRRWLGSVKPNIGHLDTAAGVASFVKAVEALKHAEIPPTVHFRAPNPLLELDAKGMTVNAEAVAWPRGGEPRRAGVSSLGVGGTNAHVIVEEAPRQQSGPPSRPLQLLTLSARSEDAVRRAGTDLAAVLAGDGRPDAGDPAADLADAAFTLHVGRRAFDRRTAVVAGDGDTAADLLTNERRPVHEAIAGRPVVFMLPGGGAQRPGMGAELYRREPAYRDAVDECLAALPADLSATLRRLTIEAGPDTDPRELEQPLLSVLGVFVADYALAQLWRSLGVAPAAMIGHSLGEWVAACLAGVISLPDALRLVELRGRIFERLPEGGIVSVLLSEDEVRPLLVDGVDIATVNGPDTCAVSGPADALARFEDALARAGAAFQRVAIAVAPHSALLDPHLDEFEAAVAAVELRPPSIPYASNLTGALVTAEEALDPAYWRRQLRHVVRFADGLAAVGAASPQPLLLEVGPGEVLTGLARAAGAVTAVPSLRRDHEAKGEQFALLSAVGDAWSLGADIDWNAFHTGERRRRVSLPTYPFEHKRHWIDPGAGRAAATGAPERAVTARESLYRRAFRPLDPATAATAAGESWLVLSDRRVGPRLVKQLDDLGHRVVSVRPGDGFERDEHDRFVVDPTDPDSAAALFAALDRDGAMPTHVAALWLLDADDTAGARRLGFDALLHLVQGWATEQLAPSPLRLIGVTNGAQALEGERVLRPGHALTLGPLRVAPKELPDITARCVDVRLDDDAMEDALDEVVTQLVAESNSDGPEVVVLRDGRRYGETIEAVPMPAETATALRTGGVYLITGGLGALGLAHARYLAETAGARVVLVGRTAMPSREEWDRWVSTHGPGNPISAVIARIREIEAAGGEVLVATADVTDADQLRAVVADVVARFGAVHGVIHAAGTLDDTAMQLKRSDAASRVLRPKVEGTLALLDAVADRELDFVALFSSASSVMAPAGQVDYTAANAFLNAVAASDRLPWPVVAVNWTSWRGEGMATRALAAIADGPGGDAGAGAGEPGGRATGHPLLGTCVAEGPDGATFEVDLDPRRSWVLDEHRLAGGDAVLPGAAYVELARAAAEHLRGDTRMEIRDLELLSPLQVDEGGRRVRIELHRQGDGMALTVVSGEAGDAVLHARAVVAPPSPRRAAPGVPAPASGAAGVAHPPLQDGPLRFGPRWRSLVAVDGSGGEASGVLRLVDEFVGDFDDHGLHPALVDLAFDVALRTLDGAPPGLAVPARCGRITVHGRLGAVATVRARRRAPEPGALLTADVDLFADDGEVVATFEGLSLVAVDPGAFRSTPSARSVPAPAAASPAPAAAERLARWTAAGIDADLGTEAFSLAIALAGLDVSEVIVSPVDPLRLIEELAPSPPVATGEGDAGAATTSAAPRTETERVLARMWSDLLGAGDIAITDSFFDLGGHSLLAARLFARLNKQFGTSLGLATLLEAPTIEQLAAVIDPEGSAAAETTTAPAASEQPTWTSLVPLQKEGDRPPFFVVHPVGGNVMHFLTMSRYLKEAGWPVWGLQAKGVDGNHPLHRSVEDMAAHYIAELRDIAPRGPYYLGGSSFGGVVAWEVAQQLTAAGEDVAVLAMFDTWGPGYPQKLPSRTAMVSRLDDVRYRVALHVNNLKLIEPQERTALVKEKAEILRRRAVVGSRRRMEKLREQLDRRHVPAHLKEVEKAGVRADQQYEPKPYPGRAILFRAMEQPRGIYENPTNGWEGLALGGLDIDHVPGFHGAFLEEPGVRELAPALIARLEAAWATRR